MLKIFLKKDIEGGVNQLMFLHHRLLQGVMRPREITSSLFAICNVVLFWNCLYIFNIYPKRRGEAVTYERLLQYEVWLYTEICKFKWIFIFYFQPCSKILLTVHDITISEPHYLLFYSADCKYTAAIRQCLEMSHFSIVTKIYNSIYNSTVNAWEECSPIVWHSRRYSFQARELRLS